MLTSHVDGEMEAYAIAHSLSQSSLLMELEQFTMRHMPVPEAMSGPLVGQLLRFLVRLSAAKRVLEIGTFTGYATLSIAEALPPDGKIVTCEINPRTAEIASTFFDKSPHRQKIDLRLGDALAIMKTLSPSCDLVFIDAEKERYPTYYEEAVRLCRIGGCIVIDNALARGGVTQLLDERSRATHFLNERICTDSRVESVLVTVRDGVQLVWKRAHESE